MTVTSDRQVEFAGVLLDPPYRLQGIEGLLGLPELRVSDLDRVARDGVTPGHDWLGGRTVTVTLIIDSFDSAVFSAAVSALQAACVPTGAERPLSFRIPGVAGGNTAWINARARRGPAIVIDTAYNVYAAEAVIEFRATDPLIYADTVATLDLLASSPSGGFTFPLTFNLSFGAVGSAGTATVTNSGNYTAPVSIRINGPVTTPRLRNETTGEELAVDIDIAAGEWVDLDTNARTVLLNGTANRYHLLTSAQWWGLAPGANELRFTAAASTGAIASVTYRSVWL